MKNDFKFLVSVLIGVFFLLVCSNISADEIVVESVVGIVTSEAQIKTDDGDMCLIGPSEKSQEILKLSGKRIEATGRLYETDGEKTMIIDSYWLVGTH